MSWTNDNRWSPGASGAEAPADAPAAYSARWIDMGDGILADVVPDRQGFAYNDPADRDRLVAAMAHEGDGLRTPDDLWDRDVTTLVVTGDRMEFRARRSGGYIYVDAWLTPTTPDGDRYTIVVDGHRMMHSAVQPRTPKMERDAEEMAAIYRDINPGDVVAIEWEHVTYEETS